MREIKFRCWNKERKEMVYDVDLYSGGLASEGTNDNPYEFDEKTLGQYTGLKDKNGKEIYEGDLVKCKMVDIDIKAKVVYSPERAIFGLSLIGVAPFSEFNNLEVIGNIYENPELLSN